MTWHVLPSIGLIVVGVAGMGALQMGVHKLFHGKVLPHSGSRLRPRVACPLNRFSFMSVPQEKAHSLDDFDRLAGQVHFFLPAFSAAPTNAPLLLPARHEKYKGVALGFCCLIA